MRWRRWCRCLKGARRTTPCAPPPSLCPDPRGATRRRNALLTAALADCPADPFDPADAQGGRTMNPSSEGLALDGLPHPDSPAGRYLDWGGQGLAHPEAPAHRDAWGAPAQAARMSAPELRALRPRTPAAPVQTALSPSRLARSLRARA